MLIVRYEAQRSSAEPHSAEFILSLPKGFVHDPVLSSRTVLRTKCDIVKLFGLSLVASLAALAERVLGVNFLRLLFQRILTDDTQLEQKDDEANNSP